MAERLKGFVVGSNLNHRGETVWKVRAKDATGRYDRRKFLVVSQSEEFTMKPGLNVDFIPAEMDGSQDGKILCAVDVRLEVPSAQ